METMTKEQLAELLNGGDRYVGITKGQEYIAQNNNLLVLFGYYDDSIKMRGAIHDNVDAIFGGDYLLVLESEMYPDYDLENTYHKTLKNKLIQIPYTEDNDNNPRLVRAQWRPDDIPGVKWQITSNMPHASFTINEGDQPYCEGIVLDLDEISGRKGIFVNKNAEKFIDECIEQFQADLSDQAKWQLREAMSYVAEVAKQETKEQMSHWNDPREKLPVWCQPVEVKYRRSGLICFAIAWISYGDAAGIIWTIDGTTRTIKDERILGWREIN